MKKQSPVSRGGRFADGPALDATQFTQSVSFDWRLWEQDILGSLAHAAMLHKIGLLTQSEFFEIENALDQIGADISAGRFQWKRELEDVHMNIEAELTRRATELQTQTYRPLELYTVLALEYLAMLLVLTWVARLVERTVRPE